MLRCWWVWYSGRCGSTEESLWNGLMIQEQNWGNYRTFYWTYPLTFIRQVHRINFGNGSEELPRVATQTVGSADIQTVWSGLEITFGRGRTQSLWWHIGSGAGVYWQAAAGWYQEQLGLEPEVLCRPAHHWLDSGSCHERGGKYKLTS